MSISSVLITNILCKLIFLITTGMVRCCYSRCCAKENLTPCKRIWIPELVKFLLVESGTLGFGSRNTAQGIWNPANYWNPESKLHWQRPESSTCNVEQRREIQNPRRAWIPLHGARIWGYNLILTWNNLCTTGCSVKQKVLYYSALMSYLGECQ